MTNLKTKLAEIKALCDAAPLYPHKKWPVAFVQYPEVNEMLDFALNSRNLFPQLIKCVEVLDRALADLTYVAHDYAIEQESVAVAMECEKARDARKQAEEILGGTE